MIFFAPEAIPYYTLTRGNAGTARRGTMRLAPVLIIVLMAGVLFGCGSGNRITRDLLISSDPEGASVYLDGDKMGETPLKIHTFFTWNRDNPYDSLLRRVLQVRKNGYIPQSRDLFPIDMPTMTFFLTRENVQEDKKAR